MVRSSVPICEVRRPFCPAPRFRPPGPRLRSRAAGARPRRDSAAAASRSGRRSRVARSASLAPPAAHSAVVAREQDAGHDVAAPRRRAACSAASRARHPRRSPPRPSPRRRALPAAAGPSPRHGQRGGLAARQHEVAEAQLLRRKLLGDTLVDALVAAAQQHQPLEPGVAARGVLVEAAASWREQHDRPFPRAPARRRSTRAHARTAPPSSPSRGRRRTARRPRCGGGRR